MRQLESRQREIQGTPDGKKSKLITKRDFFNWSNFYTTYHSVFLILYTLLRHLVLACGLLKTNRHRRG